jgi:fatty acid desaturase
MRSRGIHAALAPLDPAREAAPDYAREVRAALPAEAFAPAGSRIAWLPVQLAAIVGPAIAIATGAVPWPVALFLSVVIGFGFGGLAFLGHETLHGAVIRGARAIQVVGWICLAPFMVSPRLWTAWHNRVHHNHTMKVGVDPDAFPTLEAYRESALLRFVTSTFSLGRGNPLGITALLLGFTVQSAHMLVSARALLGMSRRHHRIAIAQTLAAAGMWTAVAVAVGPLAFLFVYVIPIMIANAIVMSYILTNHSLSPLTSENDALRNSLSVTTPRWYEFITLGFGMHVEHHVVPTISNRHAPRVREILRARWPDRYQSMPLHRALWRLARTGRVYKTPTTLYDPRTGAEWPTLGTRASD